jgi:hypothetical protein
MTIGTSVVSYNRKKQLKDAISYKINKEYRLVNKTFWGRTFNMPLPIVLLKTRDRKIIEMNKLFFYTYID